MHNGYVITPRTRLVGLRELWRRRGLFWSLTLREIQIRYRQAVLGVAWAVLQPVALAVVTTVVFSGFLSVSSGDVPYPLFVFTALVPWTYFHTAVTAAVPSLVTNADLVRKIWFPREALPLAGVAAALLDLVAGLALWAIMLAGYHQPLAPTLLYLPLLLLILLVAAAAVALLGSAINVYFRDVKHALPLLLQVVFFATPIVYPFTPLSETRRTVLSFNPLTAVVEGLRDIAIHGRTPDLQVSLTGASSAAILFVLALLVFRRAERRFADVV